MVLVKCLASALVVFMISGCIELASAEDYKYQPHEPEPAPAPFPHVYVNETIPHNETKVEIENSEPHKLRCQNFKVSVKLLHPPSSPRGSEDFDRMECHICENIRLIYRCYPCFHSLKFLGINHLPDNETAAVFVMKFGCEGKHLKVLEAILKPHSIIHAECFEPECPPESPEIHLVQPCIVPEISQCSAQICTAPETYTVTPYPTDCPPAVPPQIPMASQHVEVHQAAPPAPPPVYHELHHPVVHSPYPDPYNHVYPHNAPSVDGHHGEAPEEHHKEQDKESDEESKEGDNEEQKEEHKPAEPQAVGVVGQTFVNGQWQPLYPPVHGAQHGHEAEASPVTYPYPYGFPSQIAAPVPYPYGACHPSCGQRCSTTCHPACCRSSRLSPKTRYRAYLQSLKNARKTRSFHQG